MNFLKLKKQNSNNLQPSNSRVIWSRIFARLQMLGKALLYPIAILPFAALLNRFGTLGMDLNPIEDGVRNVGNWIGFIISRPGAIVFDNLPLFFAIGTGFGLAKENRGEVALVAALMYLAITAFLIEGGLPSLMYKGVLTFDTHDGKAFSELFYVKTFGMVNNKIEVTGGKYILDIGALGGIISGSMTAYLYNKFKDIQLPEALGFFGGRRFVPMMVMLVSLPLAFLFSVIWPWIQFGLVKFGGLISSSDAWSIPGAFLYALVNRIIQPFGLHHIINTFLWFQMPIENYITDINGKIVLDMDAFGGDKFNIANLQAIASHWQTNISITESNWKDYFVLRQGLVANSNNTIFATGNLASATAGMYTVFGDINAFQKSVISGTFQTGYFPMYWGGLTAAAGAMVLAAPKENRKKTITFLAGIAFVAALTGIDEPIVFAFIFVGPILWAYNAVFTAIFAAIGIAMHMHIGFGFSAGLIDYIISFANSWGMSKAEAFIHGPVYGVTSNPLWMLLLAALIAPVYFFSFYFTIKKLDIPTPGREKDLTNIQVMKK
ncbi:PTS system, N-acetylglucosamine-specific IIBC component [Williamsoniiplasma luminosum]|uniref:PTS system, N-acetylglucosamine-specific IIBC component n=1 Tax=Williamsoniiplasma luminosum TaxID=214888 RepID=A0A2K8NUJ3_9MOLU|nr:PTS transporter subunit EIIC [Williamsoniiplasma luminosum]ATZ17512.1 PTS system, N-acetylglucosamine-specific IIBC component [Williamsoniiplasma luminosum]